MPTDSNSTKASVAAQSSRSRSGLARPAVISHRPDTRIEAVSRGCSSAKAAGACTSGCGFSSGSKISSRRSSPLAELMCVS